MFHLGHMNGLRSPLDWITLFLVFQDIHIVTVSILPDELVEILADLDLFGPY